MEHDIFCNCEDCCYSRGGEICPTCGCLVVECPTSKGCGCVDGSDPWFYKEAVEYK
jgi:hypothetical protein